MDYKNLIYIGSIYEVDKNKNSPKISDSINKPIKNKEIVVRYLKSAEIIAASPGVVIDVITNKIVTLGPDLMSDGVYEWRSDLVYYVEKYDLELPEEFIKHILDKMQTISFRKV